MALPELAKLTDTELYQLRERLEKIIAEREERRQREVMDQIRKLASEAGLSVEIRGDGRRRGARRPRVEAKYRNPANPDETWSGRGRAPRWLTELEKQGRNREDFRIPG